MESELLLRNISASSGIIVRHIVIGPLTVQVPPDWGIGAANTFPYVTLRLYMIHGKKLIVVMPAYNAAKTLEKTYAEVPLEYVDEVILVEDASRDDTAEVARKLGITTIVHLSNKGYGGNQKTCYR